MGTAICVLPMATVVHVPLRGHENANVVPFARANFRPNDIPGLKSGIPTNHGPIGISLKIVSDVGYPPMVNVAVGGQSSLLAVFVHFNLEVNSDTPQCPDYDIGAHASFRVDVSHWVFDFLPGCIVNYPWVGEFMRACGNFLRAEGTIDL